MVCRVLHKESFTNNKKIFKKDGFGVNYPAWIWTELYALLCNLSDRFWGYIEGVIGINCKKVLF